jgi:hypothetical protein
MLTHGSIAYVLSELRMRRDNSNTPLLKDGRSNYEEDVINVVFLWSVE